MIKKKFGGGHYVLGGNYPKHNDIITLLRFRIQVILNSTYNFISRMLFGVKSTNT